MDSTLVSQFDCNSLDNQVMLVSGRWCSHRALTLTEPSHSQRPVALPEPCLAYRESPITFTQPCFAHRALSYSQSPLTLTGPLWLTAREYSLKILSHDRELNQSHGEDREWDTFIRCIRVLGFFATEMDFDNRWVKVERGQLWSDQSPSWIQQHFLTATECSHARDQDFPQNFSHEHANAPTVSLSYHEMRKPSGEWVKIPFATVASVMFVLQESGGLLRVLVENMGRTNYQPIDKTIMDVQHKGSKYTDLVLYHGEIMEVHISR